MEGSSWMHLMNSMDANDPRVAEEEAKFLEAGYTGPITSSEFSTYLTRDSKASGSARKTHYSVHPYKVPATRQDGKKSESSGDNSNPGINPNTFPPRYKGPFTLKMKLAFESQEDLIKHANTVIEKNDGHNTAPIFSDYKLAVAWAEAEIDLQKPTTTTTTTTSNDDAELWQELADIGSDKEYDFPSPSPMNLPECDEKMPEE